MIIKPIKIKYNINRETACDIINVSHSYNRDTKYIELQLFDGCSQISLDAECTATANYVNEKNRKLYADSVECIISENDTVLIPFDRKFVETSSGVMKIELLINKGEKTLALPFPLRVIITDSVLENAEITEESCGTISEKITELSDEMDNLKSGLDKKLADKIGTAIASIEYRSLDDYEPENYGGYLVYDAGEGLIVPLANLDEELGGSGGGDLSDYYTKNQTNAAINSAIQTAIGGVENGSY